MSEKSQGRTVLHKRLKRGSIEQRGGMLLHLRQPHRDERALEGREGCTRFLRLYMSQAVRSQHPRILDVREGGAL